MANQFVLKSILVAVGVQFLVTGTLSAQTRFSERSFNQQSLSRGTSDSGGGTGVDRKVFESYVIDPTKLPAFEQYVKPLLANIKRKTYDGRIESAHLEDLAKMRTWYLVPMRLSHVAKDSLGLDFIKDETQQIARQSLREIWIDKSIFIQMTTKAQADLIVHEMVMSLYFMQFLKMSEICQQGQLGAIDGSDQGVNCDPQETTRWDRLFAPVPLRSLNAEDNENIRFVTNWLLQNGNKEIDEATFDRLMLYRGFDRRFFQSEANDRQNKIEKISYEEILRILRKAELTDFMPDICKEIGGQAKEASCRITFEKKPVKIFNREYDGIRLRVVSEEKVLVDFDAYLGGNFIPGPGIFGAVIPPEVVSIALLEARGQYRVGQPIAAAHLILSRGPYPRVGGDEFSLSSIVVQKGVVASIRHDREKTCEVKSRRWRQAFDLGFIARSESAQYLEKIEDYLLHFADLLTFCSKENSVQE